MGKVGGRGVALTVAVLVCSAGGVAIATVTDDASGGTPTGVSLNVAPIQASHDVLTTGPAGAAVVPVDGSASDPLTRYVAPGYGIAVDSAGDLYVPDLASNQVVEYPADNDPPVLVSTGSFTLDQPTAVTVDAAGSLYIVDNGNSRVLKVPAAGAPTVIDSDPQLPLANPLGIAIDTAGDLYVSDTGQDPNDAPGQVVRIPHNGDATVVSTGAIPLASPAGLALDASGDLYIADAGNDRIVEVPAAGSTRIVDTGSTTLSHPTGLASGSVGELYVGDGSGKVYQIPSGGGTASVVGFGPFPVTAPMGIATGPDGDLYVADQFSRVVRLGAHGAATVDPYMLDGASAATYDPIGNAFLADTGNGRVVEFPADGSNPSIVDTGSASLQAPDGVAIDPAGNLDVADGSANAVYQIPVGGGSATALETGDLSLQDPRGLAIDSVGDVYIADSGNDRIVKLPAHGGGAPSVVDVSPLTLSDPEDVAVDATGNLHIANTGGGSVIEIRDHGGPATAVPTGTVNLVEPAGVSVDPAGDLFIADHDGNQTVEVPADGSPASVIATTKAAAGIATKPQVLHTRSDDPITLTATVLSSSGDTPTGTVTFYAGSTALGTLVLSDDSPDLATLTTTLPPGAQPLTAVYNGDDTHAASPASTPVMTQVASPPDSTPPIVTATVLPTPNGAGWNNTSVTVQWSTADDSGSATQPPDMSLSSEGAQQVVTSDASCDPSGNCSAGQVTINVDVTVPVGSVSPNRAADFHGWYTSPVTESFHCSDALSGVASCPAPVTVSGDGADQTVTGTVIDVAGNTTAVTSDPVSVDTTAPLLTYSLSGPQGDGGWWTGPVTVHWSCSDATSGVADCPSDSTIHGEGTGLTATATATDVAGNTTTLTTGAVSIDPTPPTGYYAPDRGPDTASWYRAAVTETASCADATSGVASCPAQQLIDNDGTNQTVSGTVTDNAGNDTTITSTPVNLDKTAPTLNYSLSGTQGQGGWFTSAVTVTWTCADTGSGVASCPNPTVLSADGAAQTVTGTSSDIAGNTTTHTTAPINVDRTPGTSTITTTGTNGIVTSRTITGTARDVTSGSQHVIVTMTPGITGSPTVVTATCMATAGKWCTWSAQLPNTAGTYTVTAAEVDRAGNRQVSGNPSVNLIFV